MKKQRNWINRIVLVAIFMLAGLYLQPMEANAQLHENAHLNVAGIDMVKRGVVLETVVKDGMGGSATYNVETNTLTLDYIYYTGNTPTVTTTIKKWQSYILPKFDTNYTIIFRFKSSTVPSFKTESYKSPDGDKYKNCYLYTLQYKAVK